VHVVLVSNCEQAALGRTRTLLDRYGTRIGDRAWATLITQQALDELHSALRRVASRHTSVACYRSDSTVGLRLIWVVGNRSAYDLHGRFAVATAQRKTVLALPYRHAALIARLAGYAHDLGKASVHFQNKLKESCAAGKANGSPGRDPIRHEWLSAWLFRHVLREGSALEPQSLRLAWEAMRAAAGDRLAGPASQSAPPLELVMHSALDAVGWAVCTHHGAIGGALDQPAGIDGACHIHIEGRNPQPNLTLAHAPGGGTDAARWVELLQAMDKLVRRLRPVDQSAQYWEGVMLMARAALILSDHAVSAGTFPGSPEEGIVYANTKPESALEPQPRTLQRAKRASARRPVRRLDQPLSWHLLRVGERAAENLRMLAGDQLPALERELTQSILAARAEPGSPFAWQDRAAEYVSELRGGKLVFDVASTGAGKTLANLKIALAMRPEAARLAVAFNLRSLTHQTFEAFGKHVRRYDAKAFARDFVCLLGERGAVERDFSKEDEDDIKTREELELDGARDLVLPEWLKQIAGRSGESDAEAKERLAKLIASPVLVCTMDWIVASGEPGEQDRHAKALIRVAHSDLILDEVDSYDTKAAVAVMRVVQTAATFGRNVIVSSATLNPPLARGIALAYSRGRAAYEAMFGAEPWHLVLAGDRFDPQSTPSPSVQEADTLYRDTMRSMAQGLCGQAPLRRAEVVPVQSAETFCSTIAKQALALHEHNATSPPGLPCRLSIGLVRVAQVETCMNVSDALRECGQFTVTAYHARDVQERRAYKEKWLDRILDRNGPSWVDALLEVMPKLKDATGDVRLVVVATPVEEVGRDHDFDWAIIEPSSMHSIVQTAGRVNRHRREGLAQGRVNVSILSENLRSARGEKFAFVRPGLETESPGTTETTHRSHDMRELLRSAIGSEFDGVVDAGLVFDANGRKATMSQCDEQAVKLQMEIAMPVIERSAQLESHFMLAKFTEMFPLRERGARVVYELDLSRDEFYKAPRPAGDTAARCGEVCYSAPPATGVWLSPDLLTDPFRSGRLLVALDSRYTPNGIERLDVLWNGVRAR